MINKSILSFLFICCSVLLIAQPKTYLCMKPAMEMSIDGELTEWMNTPQTDDFIDITGDYALKPDLQTNAMMMWDDQYLYIAAEMEEPHLWATVTERDQVMYVDNDFEVFIDPDGDTHNYAEIEVNAFESVWDLFLTRPYRDGTIPLNSYNINGLQLAVKLKGSINDPSDTDTGWVLEMAIPWNALTDMTYGNRKPYAGEYWRINFSRVQWQLDVIDGEYVKKEVPEDNWVWSEQGSVNMHMPERWGYVFFSNEQASINIPSPELPHEERTRSFLRDLYFTQKQFHRENGHYSDRVEDIDTNSLVILQYGGRMKINATEDQFLISYSGFRQTDWYIDQTGRIWSQKTIKAWIWMHGDNKLTDEEWSDRFQKLSSYGIDGILLGGSNEILKRILPLAEKENIEIQAWRWMLNCNDKNVIEDHPEWYSVSREGFSCLEKQPYVGYYKWLCPSREGVQEYLKTRVRETLSIEGLSGFHMDYIRHPDVILPVALWSTYGLVQDHDMPEYDYCYCDVCRSSFKENHGYDPLDLEHPDQDSAWRQFGYDIVSNIVNSLQEERDMSNKKLSAAVFPSPEIARTLVRQDWDQWLSLSEVFPMIYHSFYNEDLAWVGETTWEGVHALNDRIPLYTGLYIPALSPSALSKAILIAIDGGASGVSLFDYNAMTDEHWEYFRKRMNTYK